jgi:phosphatidylserine decarboxylase
LQPQPLPADIAGVQPGGGWIVGLELAWGRLRRKWLRTCRPGYVARMRQRRRGDCPGCKHDPVDARDLKFFRNTCGYWFAPEDDPFRWRALLPFARWGWAEILVLGGPAAILALVAAWLWPWAAIPPALWAIFVAAFFRDPPRRIPTEAGALVAPADGIVTDVVEQTWDELLGGPAVRIGIYLSIFDVHVNRSPATARVIEIRYFPGRFRDVRHAAAPRENEQLWTLLECGAPPQMLLVVKQIAGMFARRIVCILRPGEVIGRGDKIGMIKFGSRTELYLPKTPELVVSVRPGDRVRGGSSIVARRRVR